MNNCIEWKGCTNTDGYGWKTIKNQQRLLHRVAWEWVNGPIQEGRQVLHKCDNPPCVNPDHLFLGDHSTNMADRSVKGRHHNQKKTHCINGHELIGKNLYINKSSGQRVCKICRRSCQNRLRRIARESNR